jgi:hypothetical protein
MAILKAKRVFVALGALIALSACLDQKPGGVKTVENRMGDESAPINAPAAEGLKDAETNAALEYIGPAGEIVTGGAAVMNAAPTAATIAIRDQMNRAELQATMNPEQVYQDRADYFSAKYNCLLNPKNCAEWYKWQKRGLPPLPAASDGGGHGGHGGGD